MKRLFVVLSVCAVISFTGCIDREFDLAETSGEMTIGGEELVVPIAEVGRIAIGDLLKDNETLKPNEEGVYQISFSSFGDNPDNYEELSINGIEAIEINMPPVSIDPVGFSFQELPTQLSLGGIEKAFEVEFPEISDIVKIIPITMQQDLELNLPGIKGQGTLPGYLVPSDPFVSSANDKFEFNASLSILEQLKKVDWIEFGCEDHPNGAPFTIKVQLEAIYDIIGDGSLLDLHVEFPQGYYLRDENGKDLPEESHNIVNVKIPLNSTTLNAQNKYTASAEVFLHRINYSDHEFENGILNINDEIKYSYNLSLQLCAGNYNFNNSPKFSIEAEPGYKDVEIVINHFDTPVLSESISYSFNGLPSQINLESIAFTEDSELTVSLHGLEWLKAKDNLTGEDIAPFIEIGLPKCMHFRQHELLKDDNTLIASTTALMQGVKLSLKSIDCTSESVSMKNGALTINESITTSIHLETLDNHTVLVSTLTPPDNLVVDVNIGEAKLAIDTANSKVTWNGDEPFDLDLKDDQIPSLSQVIDIPEMIASIEKIGISKAGTEDPFSITFAFGVVDGAVFPVETLEVDVTVNLGKLLVPTAKMLENKVLTQNANGDYLLVIKEDWKPNQTKLSRTIEFEALANIPGIFDGKISLNQSFPVVGSVNIKSNEDIKLSEIDGAKIDVDVDIDDLAVRSFTGGVNISVAPEPMVVELGDMGDLGVDINILSLNPVLNVKLKDNPTGVPFAADLAVKTFDSEDNELQTITVPTIKVEGEGASNIVLCTPRNAEKYKEMEGVTNVVAIENLSNLLLGGIPAKIAVDMSVATNAADIYTIDLSKAANGYTLEYQYEATIPLEIDGNLDISYETTVSGLNDTFASLADQTSGLKVGDIGLIAEFGSTIPFNVVVSAELVNAEGTTEDLDARLNINECLIKGCNPKTGEKSISNVDLDFDLGESHSLAGLKNADGIRLKFTLYGADAEGSAKLSEEQFIDAKLKLRVRDGLTVDIFDFLK